MRLTAVGDPLRNAVRAFIKNQYVSISVGSTFSVSAIMASVLAWMRFTLPCSIRAIVFGESGLKSSRLSLRCFRSLRKEAPNDLSLVRCSRFLRRR